MTPPRQTVLVVDDDADAHILMRAALLKAGFEVRTAHGGQDALNQFRAAPCDLVMLDVEMPDMSGHEVCAVLRAEAGALLPIVMVTGMDDVSSVERAYANGATDFISKPVHWALLGHRVRYLFRGLQALQDLQAEQARTAAILNAIPDLLLEVDIDGRYIDCRAPHAHLLPIAAADLVGKTIAEVLPTAAADICMAALHAAHINGTSSGAQFELPLPQGTAWFELSVSSKAVRAGDKARFIVMSRDISKRKQAEAGMVRLAHFDSLTGLPNRLSFLQRLDLEITASKGRCTKLALLFMDLDGFKNINDSMGHASGDLILQQTAERLRVGLRPNDVLSRVPVSSDEGQSGGSGLARLGGDEFTAMVLDVQSPDDALAVAGRIGALMRRPFVVQGRDVTLTSSIGIAIYPQDGADAATLLKHADTAMYHAKRSGRDNAQLYCTALTNHLVERMDLDASLRVAQGRGEFHLLYQPQIDADTGRMCAVEALIRWVHPTRGLVSPTEFIPLAEENGLIEHIGLWVLRTATADAARWNKAGTPLKVAVNLSPVQFNNPQLASLVAVTLGLTGLPPELLELEVTEGALMANTAATRTTLNALRGQGISIALDDFGTGFSSLAYLTRMPIGNIKIDKCFITRLLEGGENEAIVRAVLAMAGSLGMRVTAEGVGTRAQARALKGMACDSLQGFYFSCPVTADQVAEMWGRRWDLGAVHETGRSAEVVAF